MSKDSQWIVGINAVSAAVEHDPDNVREVLLEAGAKNPRIGEIEVAARRKDIAVRRVVQNALDGVAGGLRHQGAVARYAAARTWDEHDLAELVEAADGKALLLVLDGVQDPHNLGACLRTAGAAGADAVLVPRDGAVGLTATVRKVASGAAERVPLFRATNLGRSLDELKRAGFWVHGAAGEADVPLWDVRFDGPCVVVCGSEGGGLRRLTRERCDVLFRIPMAGGVESLNVGVAAGVALFEVRRQRAATG